MQAWAREFHAASIALHDREAKVEAAAQKMECQLQLLGATAVEDRLQTGVPKAVHTLLQAGIRVRSKYQTRKAMLSDALREPCTSFV